MDPATALQAGKFTFRLAAQVGAHSIVKQIISNHVVAENVIQKVTIPVATIVISGAASEKVAELASVRFNDTVSQLKQAKAKYEEMQAAKIV